MNIETVRKVKHSKAFTALDAIVAVVFVGIAILAAVLIYRAPAATVTITAPEFRRTLSLDEDAVIELDHVTVHIEKSEVWVTNADCADKICERTGKISRVGQSIVCLPSGVVVTIVGQGDLQWETGR